MDLASLIGPRARIIDVGAPDARLARALADGGRHRYLGLVDPGAAAWVRAGAGTLAHRFHPLTDTGAALRNNADVLVVRGSHAPLVWAVRDLRHLSHLVVERGNLEAAAARAVARLGSAVRRRGTVTGASTTFDVLEITRPRRRERPRRYLSPVWGVAGLAARMDADGIQHAVLRWFENLPALADGEDLDLLVADDDLERLTQLLDSEPGTIPVDVYSESGLPGSDFRTAAYYPPPLAAGLLDRAVRHPSGLHVPTTEDHLHSLAYHALYHKGHTSGLPSGHRLLDAGPPEHDYGAALAKLAGDLGLELELTLEGLDEYLDRVGWRPPPDTLRRLATGNRWLTLHAVDQGPATTEPPEPAVFLVRERTAEVLPHDELRGVLAHYGFEVLAFAELTADESARTAAHARGGNWGRGPFPVSGGRPTAAVVAVHHAPGAVHPRVRDRYPRLSNAEVLHVKNAIRDLVRGRTGSDGEFNPVHSSDDEIEAWEYVALAVPDAEKSLRDQVRARRRAFRTPVPVRRTLSRGRRAKVEVVDDGSGPVVRKTYAGAFRAHLDRELQAMRSLAPLVDALPQVLATGETWFELPYYEDRIPAGIGPTGPRLVPVAVLRQMVGVLRRLHELGYELIDAKPDNFVLDARHGLKVLDLEFVHHRTGSPVPLAGSMSFVAPPRNFAGDVPVGDLSYEKRWLPRTGMPVGVLLDGTTLAQHAHRTIHRLRRATVRPGSPARRAARRGVDAARAVKGRAVWSYTVWARARVSAATPRPEERL